MAEPNIDDILKTLKSGGARELIRVGRMQFPNGAVIEKVEVDTPDELESVVRQASAYIAAAAPSVMPPTSGKARRLQAHGVVVSKRVPEYLEYLKSRHPKYIAKAERVCKMLIDISGDLPPDDYDPDVIDRFVNTIKFLPPNPEKNKLHRERWAKMNFLELAKDVESKGLKRASDTTVKDHITQLASFFSFCKGRRYMEEDSPFAKRVADASSGTPQELRDPFDDADLQQIFDPVLYQSRKLPHTFWPPLIALFTGARCNEIAQLYLDDVVNDDKDHPERWRFMIRVGPGRSDQRLKNKFSSRSIPLHPRLIELGFLSYLEDVRSLGFDRVFPSLRWTAAAGYGDTVSDMFSAYLRGKVKISDPRKVFHSFRHYFCTQAKNYGKDDPKYIAHITGHAREGEFELTYARELFYENKLEILTKIPLPRIDLPTYAPGQFLPYLKAFKRKQESQAKASPAVKAAQAKNRLGMKKSETTGLSVDATRKHKRQAA